ncbi:hypothetical protein [Pseudomarimonas salicorniae]|uniref:SGNH/GDSL hydrolase family protein n=1 Tax=Pseudomarimonas salicorniae TaxID=2933270 RepID=A0ABT0GD73_9GAMM|nr:hypothetical protein [Lysobacter sp. CAU 1642]MCK7592378.1 hypothetical protein [Lysobacter sp. CAU 1642]
MRWMLLTCLAISSTSAPAEPLRMLFIGNSYTYTHNLPEVFRRVAAAQDRAVVVSAVTIPGAAIEDHFSTGNLPDALEGQWDWVVMQQGPSSLPQNRVHLVLWTAEVARHLDPSRTRIVMFSVWPALEHAHTWANAETSYAQAASKSGGCLLPAAAAWRLALAENPGLPLYSEDRLHPSREGTLLTAITLARALWPAAGKAIDDRLARQFREQSWQPAVQLAPVFWRHAAQAVAESPPRCVD